MEKFIPLVGIVFYLIILIGTIMTLQEAYSFIDGNDTIHSFLESGIIYKCENSFTVY
jgi:hypothetical protein